jgi:hypothetical protein
VSPNPALVQLAQDALKTTEMMIATAGIPGKRLTNRRSCRTLRSQNGCA